MSVLLRLITRLVLRLRRSVLSPAAFVWTCAAVPHVFYIRMISARTVQRKATKSGMMTHCSGRTQSQRRCGEGSGYKFSVLLTSLPPFRWQWRGRGTVCQHRSGPPRRCCLFDGRQSAICFSCRTTDF